MNFLKKTFGIIGVILVVILSLAFAMQYKVTSIIYSLPEEYQAETFQKVKEGFWISERETIKKSDLEITDSQYSEIGIIVAQLKSASLSTEIIKKAFEDGVVTNKEYKNILKDFQKQMILDQINEKSTEKVPFKENLKI